MTASPRGSDRAASDPDTTDGSRSRAGQLKAAFTAGRHRRLLLFLLLVVVYLPTANYTMPMVNDNVSMAAASWNLGTNGSLEFTSQGIDAIRWGVELEDGRLYSNRFPGTFLLGAIVYRVLPVEAVRPAGADGIPLWPASAAAVLIAAVAGMVLVEVLRRVVPPGTALVAGLVVALATPFWSVAANELWTHGPAMLALGLGMLAISKDRFGLAGAAFGYAILVRPTFALVPLVVGVWAGISGRSVRPVAWIGAVSAVGLAALSIYSQVLFDTWLPVAGYTPSRATSAVGLDPAFIAGFTMTEQVVGSLFDTYRGVFLFSPFLLLLLPALRTGWRESEWWVRASAVAGLVVWVAQLRANPFPGGYHFWGYRFPLEPLFLMSPLFVYAYQSRVRHVRLWRRTTWVAIAASFAIILPGAVWFGIKGESLRPQYETRQVTELENPSGESLITERREVPLPGARGSAEEMLGTVTRVPIR